MSVLQKGRCASSQEEAGGSQYKSELHFAEWVSMAAIYEGQTGFDSGDADVLAMSIQHNNLYLAPLRNATSHELAKTDGTIKS